MKRVMYMSSDYWQGFEKGKVYIADFNYYIKGGDTWFVFKEDSPISWHGGGRCGYLVNEHKENFKVISELKESE